MSRADSSRVSAVGSGKRSVGAVPQGAARSVRTAASTVRSVADASKDWPISLEAGHIDLVVSRAFYIYDAQLLNIK